MAQVQQDAPETAEPALPLSGRLTFAARQGGIMAVALLVMAAVTNSSRPSEAADRDLVTSPFLWSIVVWVALLLFNALAFERSQMQRLEGMPSLVALTLGVVVFAVGMVAFDDGSTSDRIRYLALNSIGGVLFWWALIGIGRLMWAVSAPPTEPLTKGQSTEATTEKSMSPGRAATALPDES